MPHGATEALLRTREAVVDLAGIVAQLAESQGSQGAGMAQLAEAARAISRGRPQEAETLLAAATGALQQAQAGQQAVFRAVVALLDGMGGLHD